MMIPGLPSSRSTVFSDMDERRARAMKTLTIAAVILAMLAAPVHAQARRPQGEDKKKTDQRPPVDENAYKAALERIPDSKEKYDPWSITKPVEPARKPK